MGAARADVETRLRPASHRARVGPCGAPSPPPPPPVERNLGGTLDRREADTMLMAADDTAKLRGGRSCCRQAGRQA